MPQLRSLLERKKLQEDVVRDDAPGGEFRSHQEQFFGKHFFVELISHFTRLGPRFGCLHDITQEHEIRDGTNSAGN